MLTAGVIGWCAALAFSAFLNKEWLLGSINVVLALLNLCVYFICY